MVMKMYLVIKSALYILFTWWGFQLQVCSPFFFKGNTQQKDIKVGMAFSNLLFQTVFYRGIKLQFSEKISLISFNCYTLPSNE